MTTLMEDLMHQELVREEFLRLPSGHSDCVPNHRYEYPSDRFGSESDLTWTGIDPEPAAAVPAPVCTKINRISHHNENCIDSHEVQCPSCRRRAANDLFSGSPYLHTYI